MKNFQDAIFGVKSKSYIGSYGDSFLIFSAAYILVSMVPFLYMLAIFIPVLFLAASCLLAFHADENYLRAFSFIAAVLMALIFPFNVLLPVSSLGIFFAVLSSFVLPAVIVYVLQISAFFLVAWRNDSTLKDLDNSVKKYGVFGLCNSELLISQSQRYKQEVFKLGVPPLLSDDELDLLFNQNSSSGCKK